jgi:hypothetical protein
MGWKGLADPFWVQTRTSDFQEAQHDAADCQEPTSDLGGTRRRKRLLRPMKSPYEINVGSCVPAMRVLPARRKQAQPRFRTAMFVQGSVIYLR